MQEEDYVSAILENHMASVVKNADKIHNMFDVAYNPDKQWGMKYVEKVKHYYKDKFSTALNLSIEFAQEKLSVVEPKKEIPCFSVGEMKLFL